ncbi:MAG: 3-oxoacid CoA-transferase subunit A [Clostridiales Family XIII bacterium]|jgi:acetate CoA/acetoacetate CoA-transferase alpha subunit|nr:3-oxoacid CoA-transferase subunit A [Clostridiales Family XIII bacterium]
MNKIISMEQALDHIESGMTIMLGGFFWSGSPFGLIRELSKRKGRLRDLTLISNDAGSAFLHPESYGNALMDTGMFKKCVASFIGHNHAAVRLIGEKKLELEMVPMGTFAERIRAGGAGIGGFLTPTGVGTPVAEGKQNMRICGSDYILELPLKADVALIYGSRVDAYGHVYSRAVARNFNTVMATAAEYVIVEAREIVKSGEIEPDRVTIPGVFIDAVVQARESDYTLW